MFRYLCIVLFYVSPSLLIAQSSVKGEGKKNQIAGTNNGVMIQYNVRAKPPVKESLQRRSQEDFGSVNGWLRTITPANDVISENPSCPVPTGNLTVLLGEHGSTSSCSKDRCTILADKAPNAVNRELLSVDRKANSMQLNAVVVDETGKVIAVVDKSRTHANPTNAFDWQRPDDHTINIVDEHNRNVLHVRFANAHTVVVEGIFRFTDGRTVTVKPDKIVDQFDNSFSNQCTQDATEGAFAF